MSPEIPALWPQFVERIPEVDAILEPQVSYGVMAMRPGEAQGLRYLAGVSVSAAANVPHGMTAVTIPAGDYAVFDFLLSEIGAAFNFIFNTWFAGSVYMPAQTVSFERYNADFDPSDPNARLEAHIPIRPRTGS